MKHPAVPYQLMFLAILVGLTGGSLRAQTPFDPDFLKEAAEIHEQVQLFTDRSIYAVDETIHFVAWHRVSGPVGDYTWSNVLYVELVSPGGQALEQGKYPISGGRAEGTLHIPGESLTGDYFLKTYTRWMRNGGVQSYSYTPLKIINPNRSEVASNNEAGGRTASMARVSFLPGIVACSTASGLYQAGQEISLELQGVSGLAPYPLNCCVTVVPEGTIDFAGGYRVQLPLTAADSFQVRFLPDLGDGVSISGTVVGPDEKPVPYATLHFSMLGEDPDFFASMSDAYGRFVLTTPGGSGERKEFFVTPEQEAGSGLEVRIDQEFDSRAIHFPAEQFLLSDEERELARKIALNRQLSKVYASGNSASDSVVSEEVPERQGIPFYGTGIQQLLIDDYVRLPNLEEIFINLVPEIQFYKKRGETRIRFISDNNSIGVFSPLIMIDHISVFDHQALLSLSPEKIERVDLINDIYLKGSVSFGGVLAIYSRNGDMAGIDLPPGSYFFDYQSFNQETVIPEPAAPTGERIPDTRNTLLWLGDLRLEKDSPVELPFRAPANTGNYVVLVRGVLPDGTLFSASSRFSVE